MAFKKILTSDGHPIIVGSTKEDADVFPPGFCYRIGVIIYTVKADVTEEASSPMREVVLSDGTTEIILISSIRKDLREPDCDILESDKKYMAKTPIEKTAKKKVAKKKAKKKVKKKND